MAGNARILMTILYEKSYCFTKSYSLHITLTLDQNIMKTVSLDVQALLFY